MIFMVSIEDAPIYAASIESKGPDEPVIAIDIELHRSNVATQDLSALRVTIPSAQSGSPLHPEKIEPPADGVADNITN
jgi:hypothetical protein